MKRLIVLLLVLFVLFVFFSFTSPGQTLNVAKLDSLFNSLASRDLAIGSLTISKNGIIQYQRAIGYSFIDNDKKYLRTFIQSTELVQRQKCLQL